MRKYCYMAVTADRYELPIAVEETLEKLCQKLGISYNSARTLRHGKRQGIRRKGFNVVKVENEEGDYELEV